MGAHQGIFPEETNGAEPLLSYSRTDGLVGVPCRIEQKGAASVPVGVKQGCVVAHGGHPHSRRLSGSRKATLSSTRMAQRELEPRSARFRAHWPLEGHLAESRNTLPWSLGEELEGNAGRDDALKLSRARYSQGFTGLGRRSHSRLEDAPAGQPDKIKLLGWNSGEREQGTVPAERVKAPDFTSVTERRERRWLPPPRGRNRQQPWTFLELLWLQSKQKPRSPGRHRCLRKKGDRASSHTGSCG